MFTKKNSPVWFTLSLILLCMLSGTHALAQETNGMIGCDAITTSADSLTVPVFIDTGTEQFDTARMELLFDAAALSNPQLTVGSDFNLDFGQEIETGSVKAVFSRNALLGATSGRAELATLTFDWTGTTTTLNFADGDDTAESGSLSFLIGTDASLANEECTVDVTVAITPTPLSPTDEPTSTNTPVSTPTNTDTPASTSTATPSPTSTPSIPLNTTTRSIQSTGFNAPVLVRLIITVVVLLTVGTALFMRQKGRLFILLFVATLTMWSYPTTSAFETSKIAEMCVGLQGERSSGGEEPIFYELYDTYSGSLVVSGESEAYPYDEMGCFIIEPVPSSAYDIIINPDTNTSDHLTLIVKSILLQSENFEPIDLMSAGNIVTLIEGDVNGDNQIDNADLDVFVSTFDISTPLCEGDTGYDERADLNEDDCVTILDASLLASNLNPGTPLTGDVPE